MRKYTYSIILALFFIHNLHAQDNSKYDLMLLSGTVQPVSNMSRISDQAAMPNEIVGGLYFRIIQFNDIPTEEEKNNLKNDGIELINYLPNYAYFASIKEKSGLNL